MTAPAGATPAGPTAGPPGAPGAAPPARRLLAAVGWDLRTLLGNGEQLLVTAVVPTALLVALAVTGTPDLTPLPQAEAALAAAVAVAVVSSAFTGQAIALAFDRRSGLVRFLVTTPLGPAGVVAGRLVAVAIVVAAQLTLLLATAALLGHRPAPAALAGLVVVAGCGTAAFAGLGLLLGGTVRAEGVLAVANLAWLAMVGLGGLVVPVERLPGAAVAGVLPPGLLGEAARAAAVEGRVDVAACLMLLTWAALAAGLAARLLRWR
ncbi:MAG: ABC transporter permease [Kineosporiaceae bacterium]